MLWVMDALAIEDFEETSTDEEVRAYVIAAVQEGLADIDAGRVVSAEEMRRAMDARFGPLKASED